MEQLTFKALLPKNEPEVFDLEWKGIPYTLTWKPFCYGGIIAHIELNSENLSALPITHTGYLSHHVPKERVDEHGGPVSYIQEWIREETKDLLDDPQGSLF